ncbi:glutathione S-transferase family protein [Poseidonocella sp. HB161398]|uniref:glutathione S-transferase family protein n=1 Tax=Poseidonocella sp. HB161398 TaxID=2320855 RepID=UPI001109D821|nr:glutathione S-transferase family protein [Poseidonocella sp. HB161398]
MTPTLYTHVLDAECYKVRLLAALLGLPLDCVAVDSYPGEETRSEAFLALAPAGTLPVLEAGGLVLCGAPAILTWLAATGDVTEGWMPQDPAPRAQMQMWLGFSQRLSATAGAARLEAMFDMPAPEGALAAAEACLRELELHLAIRAVDDGAWLVGDHPCIADIACFADVALCPDAGLLHDEFPFLRHWLYRLRALPGFLPMPGIHPLHELRAG